MTYILKHLFYNCQLEGGDVSLFKHLKCIVQVSRVYELYNSIALDILFELEI